ncbi:ABC transporter permease subunit [candidate division KSB1 bacterium]|nr:ABC transporter permease subunit [candidate division KSB1 bacterium]
MNVNILAPIWRRILAGLIDIAIILLSAAIFYAIGLHFVEHNQLPEKTLTFLMLLFFFLAQFYFYRWKKIENTPGNRIMGLLVVHSNLRTTIDGDRALTRSFLLYPFFMIWLWLMVVPEEKNTFFQYPLQSKTLILLFIWGLLNIFSMIFSPKRQNLMDRVLNSQVVNKVGLEGKIHESKKVTKSYAYLFLTLFSLFSIYPILTVFSISLRPGDRLLSKSLAIIPENATFHTYYELFFEQPFLLWLWNSVVISAIVTLVGVGLAATAGYAFSRYKFKGRATAMIGLITTQMFPATMLLLPLFIMLIKIGAYDSYYGLIIAYSATALPFTIWQMKGYYDTIPFSLEEAATIDGCSPFAAFWRIILPLATPALAITALFSFMTAWSEYLVAAVLIQDKSLFTLPLGLKLFQSSMQTSWGLYSAGAVAVSVPVVVIFLILSRWLISGLTLGSVKG